MIVYLLSVGVGSPSAIVVEYSISAEPSGERLSIVSYFPNTVGPVSSVPKLSMIE